MEAGEQNFEGTCASMVSA